ncbi:hypothetical protein LPJ53_005986 [Coemansia erecta]|uniref:Uncharacterized protein n=1 Tax=Coemansia erecta TaxID=147472 RepID=A0A9W8CN76_9FUNG|nr:hypothetical protein LPJ53_005986 [Coemansia erecta]
MSRPARPALPANRYVARTATKDGPCFDVAASKPASAPSSEQTSDPAAPGAVSTSDADATDPPAQPSPPKRNVYVLHQDVFYLRQRPFIQRWEKEQADLLAQRLPSVPPHQPK